MNEFVTNLTLFTVFFSAIVFGLSIFMDDDTAVVVVHSIFFTLNLITLILTLVGGY
jgi:hypothetical protein